MVRDYVTELYEPAAARQPHRPPTASPPAKALAAWKQRVTAAGTACAWLRGVGAPRRTTAVLGSERSVIVDVDLGALRPRRTSAVQLLHGQVSQGDEIGGHLHGDARLTGTAAVWHGRPLPGLRTRAPPPAGTASRLASCRATPTWPRRSSSA